MAGFNILEVLNGRTETGNIAEYEQIKLDYKDIVVTDQNKYSMDQISDMAAGIELEGELQEPLILGRVDGEYRLVSGHRRIAGIDLLVQEGKEKFRPVECRYKDMTELQFRMSLLIGNTFNRRMTDSDMLMQAAEWKEVLTQAKKDGSLVLEKGERVRDYVAQILGVSTGKIGDLERINNNATEEIKDQLKEGNLNVTAAAAASQLTEEQQKEIAAAAAAGEDVKSTEIQAMVEEKKQEEENKVTSAQKQANVSDTDTTDEEKENARRLHALKMLERYYTFMSDEEIRILEAILEDCKRRKREYGIEDVGATI